MCEIRQQSGGRAAAAAARMLTWWASGLAALAWIGLTGGTPALARGDNAMLGSARTEAWRIARQVATAEPVVPGANAATPAPGGPALAPDAGSPEAVRPATDAEGNPIVRAVLFYSSACPHCHDVIYYDLPPMQAAFGAGLDVAFLRTGDATASLLYDIAVTRFGLARTGVPMLVIGDKVLIGRTEIRDMLPLLVQGHLERGGADWPDIPGLEYAIPDARATPAAEELLGEGAATGPGTGPGTAPAAPVSPSAAPSLAPTRASTTAPTAGPTDTVPRPTVAPTPTPAPGPLGGCPASAVLLVVAVASTAAVHRRGPSVR